MNVKNESLDFPYDRNKEGFIRKKLYLDIFKICSVPRARNFFSVMHLQKSASFCEIVFYYFILVVLPSFPKKILGTLVHGVPERTYKQTIKHPDKWKLLNQSSSITFKHSDRCGLSISMALNKNILPNFTFGNPELRLMDHGWCLLFKTLKTLDSGLFTTNLRLSTLI